MQVSERALHRQVKKMPLRQQERFAARILLDIQNSPTEDNIDKAWVCEAERRWRELRTGKTKAIPADKVLRMVRRSRTRCAVCG